MSKRRRAESPTSPTAKSSRISQPSREIICQLPPTCHVKPTFLENTSQLESHYSTCHAHVCAEERCGSIYPEKRLLDLHHTECHDPIAALRKERGERIYACFDCNCKSMFMTPKGRRLHLIDKHKYPPNYFFSVTNYGIGRLLLKWGEGASLLRNEWKPRTTNTDGAPDNMGTMSEGHADSERDNDIKREHSAYSIPKALIAPSPTATMRIRTPPQIFDTERRLDNATVSHSTATMGTRSGNLDAVDALASSMSSLSLVPQAVQFGRGGIKGGFHNVYSGRGSGSGRTKPGRGRGNRTKGDAN